MRRGSPSRRARDARRRARAAAARPARRRRSSGCARAPHGNRPTAFALNRLPDLLADLRLGHRASTLRCVRAAVRRRRCYRRVSRGVNAKRRAARREATREDEEAGVRDHAMLGTQAAGRDVPEAHAASRASRPRAKPPCARSASTSCFTCSAVGTNAVEHAAGAKRVGGVIEEPPRLGEIDHHAVDVALDEARERVADAERPVRRRRRGSARRCRVRVRRSPRAARRTRAAPVGPTARSSASVTAAGPDADLDHAHARPRCRPRGGSGRRPSGRSAAPGAAGSG